MILFIFVIELWALFRSQIIIQDWNNKIYRQFLNEFENDKKIRIKLYFYSFSQTTPFGVSIIETPSVEISSLILSAASKSLAFFSFASSFY